jgi:hypothetical protein
MRIVFPELQMLKVDVGESGILKCKQTKRKRSGILNEPLGNACNALYQTMNTPFVRAQCALTEHCKTRTLQGATELQSLWVTPELKDVERMFP